MPNPRPHAHWPHQKLWGKSLGICILAGPPGGPMEAEHCSRPLSHLYHEAGKPGLQEYAPEAAEARAPLNHLAFLQYLGAPMPSIIMGPLPSPTPIHQQLRGVSCFSSDTCLGSGDSGSLELFHSRGSTQVGVQGRLPAP